MALATGTHFEIRASATTGNTGGAGFNIANANFPTNLTTDTNTANTTAPVCSSATYNFVAGDVGAWLYVAAGTNFIVGWYQISSVASNKATLTATIGSGVVYDSTLQVWAPSTVAGIATVGTPTGGTFGIDYSQQDTAQATATDYASVGSSTTLTSATGGFTPLMVGNFFHQTTTGTGAFGVTGWYEIVSYTNSTTVVLDRTPNSGTASVACTGFIGGAGRLNGLEDAFFEMIPASSRVWVKNGTYLVSAAITIASTNSTSTLPSNITGYNSFRGDTCNGANRPIISSAANAVGMGQGQNLFNLIFTSTATGTLSQLASATINNCKVLNTSTTAARTAFGSGTDAAITNCEFVSQLGTGLTLAARGRLFASYVHDSKTGVSSSQSQISIVNNIFEACETSAITLTPTLGASIVMDNTIYGCESKIGVGLSLTAATSPSNFVANNIFYGLTSGIVCSTVEQRSNISTKNTFNNNTTDTTLWIKSPTDIALNPTFTDASQLSGTTATTSASVLTDSGANFGIVADNVDYLHVVSGTGVTVGIYLVTSHTTTTLTVNNALGTSSGGNVVYFVTTGHNFTVGANMAAAGFPTFANTGVDCLSYNDIGAVQKQSAGGASVGASSTFC